MFCVCGSSKLPIVPLSEMPGPVPVPVLDPVAVQGPVVEQPDPSSNPVPVSSLDVSADPAPVEATEVLIQKIDEVLQTIPADPVQIAIAKLWLPQPGTSPVVLGAPMSRATQRS